MTKAILIEVVSEEDTDTEEEFRKDYESFVKEQLALIDAAGSRKNEPSKQLSSQTFSRCQQLFASRHSSDSTGLPTMKMRSSTTSLASASTAASLPSSPEGCTGYKGEALSFGRCQSGPASTETNVSGVATMFENPQLEPSNEDEGDGSCSFAEWALIAQKRCPDVRLEPVVPRHIPRLWLHKRLERPSDKREVEAASGSVHSAQMRAASPSLPTGSASKNKHWMLKA